MNRRTILAMVAVVAVLSAGVGWAAGQRIKSPAEIAADAEPPAASLITVPVEERELSTSVIIRGQIEFDDAAEISVKPGPSGASIITGVTKAPGDQLLEGEVAIEVASRPLFVLEGELPVFRPLGPGVEGPDVRQLEEALSRLGYSPGTVDDVYDNATEAAVSEFYRSAGYSPNEPTTDDLEQLESARQRVRLANESLRSARANAGNGGIPESVRLQTEQSVRQSEEAVADSKTQRDRAVAAAVAERDGTLASINNTKGALAGAESRLAGALAGIHPDTGEPPTDDELFDLRSARDHEKARLVELESFLPVTEAAIADVRLQQDRAVVDAETNWSIAVASRKETYAQYSADNGSAELIRGAETEVRSANEALAKLDAGIGTSFPSNELLFLPQLPREVQLVNVRVGDTPQGSAMTVTGSGLVIRSSVSAADRPLVKEEVEGLMEDSNLGVSVRVRVAFVADTPGGPNAGADRFAIRLEPIDEIPEDAYNQNLRVTLPFESTGGAVLAVPLAALSAGADGSSRVQVERAGGTVETVSVTTGLLARALGLVEVTPIDGGLVAGDRVIVGRDNPTAGVDSGTSDSTPDTTTESQSGEEPATGGSSDSTVVEEGS